jgi:hypothetical protein
MRSRRISLAPAITYAWDDVAADQSLVVIVGEPCSLAPWLAGDLEVRVHENGISADAGSGMTVELQGIAFSRDEPETTFVGETLASIELDSGDDAGPLEARELTWPWPSMARVRVTMRQATAAATSQSARISVDLRVQAENEANPRPRTEHECGCGG